MSRGLALLFGAGALLVTTTLVLPHHAGEAQLGRLIPVGTAAVVVTLLLAAPHRFSPALLSTLLAVGSALIGLCVIYGGHAGAAYAFMYVWVAVYAAVFFTLRGTALHLFWAFATYIAVLAISGDVRPPPAQWLMAAGTSAVVAALILFLSREVRGRARDLTAITELANTMGGASEVTRDSVASAVCERVLGTMDAAYVALLEEPAQGEALMVIGHRGPTTAGEVLRRSDGLAAVTEAHRTARPQPLLVSRADRRRAEIAGMVQPVLREGHTAALLVVLWEHPQRAVNARTSATLALFAAEAAVGLERIAQQSRDRERRAIELNDAIVQGLVVATYALRYGRLDIGARAVEETLARARSLVESQLEELHGPAAPQPGALRAEGRGIG
jgi:hypothetical protein